MRIILAGSRSFGAAVYDALRDDDHEIVSVWSPPKNDDALTKKVSSAATPEELAEVDVFEFTRTPERVAEYEADLFVCAHSHDFISKQARAATELGGIGYHPSLLPRHRGRDAVRWTVHMDDPIAGGSVYWLTDNVDGGPIAAQDWCWVPRWARGSSPHWRMKGFEDCVSELWSELFVMGVQLIRRALHDLSRGVIVEVPQDERHATWEPSWERPPIHRPDLPQIGPGINGYRHVTRQPPEGATWMGERGYP